MEIKMHSDRVRSLCTAKIKAITEEVKEHNRKIDLAVEKNRERAEYIFTLFFKHVKARYTDRVVPYTDFYKYNKLMPEGYLIGERRPLFLFGSDIYSWVNLDQGSFVWCGWTFTLRSSIKRNLELELYSVEWILQSLPNDVMVTLTDCEYNTIKEE